MGRLCAIVIGALSLATSLLAGAATELAPAAGRPECYVVATSHLDTQWRWTVRQTIEEYIPATLHDNFTLLERYPDYVFSFEGAFRYMLMQEYYPEEYARLKHWVRTGRWRVAGSWVDAVDVNMPSPESLVRHALYGNGFFRREFGTTSTDVFLPDCFGFGYALPSIARHCGIAGFSTQKLTWGSAYGVPFDVGLWEGVDGSALVAALRPGSYVSRLTSDLSADSTVAAAIDRQGKASGLYATVRYFGTGDQGGAPAESSVIWLERGLHGAGPVRVRSVASDQLARDVEARLGEAGGGRLALPRYRGELLMTDHGAGCYTSQAEMKRLNRRNELLADAAERAAVVADWLGGLPYPRSTLREAWVRFLWHQFHDDLTGTSIPEAYAYSWNDEAISADQFAAVLESSVGAVSRMLDTRADGVPVVVYNPLALPREDVVEARIVFAGGAPRAIRVFGPATGARGTTETPAQVLSVVGDTVCVAFLASVDPLSFAVYDVRQADRPWDGPSALSVSLLPDGGALLSNQAQLRVTINPAGDIASVTAGSDSFLAAPARLQMLDDEPIEWPAWEIDHDDLMAPPRQLVGDGPETSVGSGAPARLRIVEQGPVRATVEVTREAEGSLFVQRYSLTVGRGNESCLEVTADIDWRTTGTLLKAAFPLAANEAEATYGLGLGAIVRGVNTPRLYEVPAQQWADLTSTDGSRGLAVLSHGVYGWDHPDPTTLRLTLLHTPRVNPRWRWVADQGSQDLGRHRVRYALYGHRGDWRTAGVPARAARFEQPLRAFQTPPHRGRLGRMFSFLRAGMPEVAIGEAGQGETLVQALKLAEQGDEIVVRLQECFGAPARSARVQLAAPILSVREIDGAEQPWRDPPAGLASPRGPVTVTDGLLTCDLGPYQMRAFAAKVARAPERLAPPEAEPLDLPWNLDGISANGDRTDGDFDGQGRTLADELLPRDFVRTGVSFRTGPREAGEANVVACAGQRLRLPQGYWNRVHILAASVGGDQEVVFKVDGRPHPTWLQDWSEPIAQWDNRVVAGSLVTKGVGLAAAPGDGHEGADRVLNEERAAASRAAIDAIVPAYRKPARVGWVGGHRHLPEGDDAYALAHVFLYRLVLPPGSRWLELPHEPDARIIAISVARNENDEVVEVGPLPERSSVAAVLIDAPRRSFTDSLRVALRTPEPRAVIRYTLDGTDPTAAASVYTTPLSIVVDTTLKARAFAPGLGEGDAAIPHTAVWRPFIATADFTKLALRPAALGVAAGDLRPGLVCRYFEGAWDRLPDFAALPLAREETVTEVALPPMARSEEFGLDLRGYLLVPRDGVYTLSLRTDDGSALFLDGEPLIDSDGLHGQEDERVDVALAVGPHELRLVYFQRGGDAACELWIEGPGLAMQRTPSGMLKR